MRHPHHSPLVLGLAVAMLLPGPAHANILAGDGGGFLSDYSPSTPANATSPTARLPSACAATRPYASATPARWAAC